MSGHRITRRAVVQSAAAGTALGLLGVAGRWGIAAEKLSPVKFLEPFHGAVFNRRHGKQTADGLTIHVCGEARPGDRVTVNDTPCRVAEKRFEGEVVLHAHETDLAAIAESKGIRTEDRVRVVWDRYSVPRYRFSIDDNSFFLRDIAQKNYASLFDCWYLKMLRDLYKKYGAKFVLNIYYAAADNGEPTADSFRLRQFPNRYKREWRDNSHWLQLAFHAYANKPDWPYENSTVEKLLADFDLVSAEILRFAGPETYSPPTVIHWCKTPRAGLKPLFDRGVRVLSCDCSEKMGGKWLNYNLDEASTKYIGRRKIWKDFESGIVFYEGGITCNNVLLDQIVPTLERLAKDPNTAEIMDLFTHEQYFWPFYHRYMPDHPQRIEAAIRWCTEHGYKPVFFHEGFLGGRV